MQQDTEAKNTEQNTQPHKSKSPLWIIGGALAAIVPLVGILVWLQSQGPEQNTDEPKRQTTLVTPQQQNYSSQSAASSEAMVEEPQPIIAVEPPPPPTPEPEPAPIKKPSLPGLNDSDPAIKTSLSQANGDHLMALLTQDFVLRKGVRAIALVAEGGLVSQYRPVAPTQLPFQVTKQDNKIAMAPSNQARYTPYIEAAETMGPEALVSLYKLYYPLLEQAYQELGPKEKVSFETITQRAIKQLLEAPEIEEQDLGLKQPSVMYQYTNPEIEALPASQKLMLRMGPENRKRVKKLLKAISEQL